MASNKYVKDIDLGWKRIHKELTGLHGSFTQVGFHKNGGKHVPESGKPGKSDGPDIATVAAWNVFGTRNKDGSVHTPRRDFMNEAAERYAADLETYKGKLLDQIYAGQITAKVALALLGQRHEDQMKRTLTIGPWEPNAQSTIDAKGSSRPLINKGQMRQNIRHAETLKGE